MSSSHTVFPVYHSLHVDIPPKIFDSLEVLGPFSSKEKGISSLLIISLKYNSAAIFTIKPIPFKC